jgi:hypothetical protein
MDTGPPTSVVRTAKYSMRRRCAASPSSPSGPLASLPKMSWYSAARSSIFVALLNSLFSIHTRAAFSATFMRRMQLLRKRPFACAADESSSRNAKVRSRQIERSLLVALFFDLPSVRGSSRRKRVERFQSSVPNVSSSSCFAARVEDGRRGRPRIRVWISLKRDVSHPFSKCLVRADPKAVRDKRCSFRRCGALTQNRIELPLALQFRRRLCWRHCALWC